MTGDFSNLLDGASHLYSDSEVLQFGRKAIEHNNILYDGQVMAPWGRSDDVSKFVGYMRRVLESEGRNGQYLRGLNIDSGSSLNAMRLFEKFPAAADKQAVADFINGQEPLMQGVAPAKRSETLLNMLDKITPPGETAGAPTVSQQLEQVQRSLNK
jgi:hypothetical protein